MLILETEKAVTQMVQPIVKKTEHNSSDSTSLHILHGFTPKDLSISDIRSILTPSSCDTAHQISEHIPKCEPIVFFPQNYCLLALIFAAYWTTPTLWFRLIKKKKKSRAQILPIVFTIHFS